MKKIITTLLLMIVLVSCDKDEEIDTSPVISFVSITPSQPQAYTDEVVITISYRDGDGDLGENDSDVTNCFVLDSRTNVEYGFRIPQLAPTGSNIIIEGSIDIKMKSLGISDGTNSELATFDLYVVDRSGNQSNTITSSSITILDN